MSKHALVSQQLMYLSKAYRQYLVFTDTFFRMIENPLLKKSIRKIDKIKSQSNCNDQYIYTVDFNPERLSSEFGG